MPVTFNSNNNYSVDIITELDIDNPSVIQYSSQTNTPFVTVKITPTNPQTNPVLASNLKFDDQIPDFVANLMPLNKGLIYFKTILLIEILKS